MVETPNPYVGPRPFIEQEGHLFFGREREAQELLSLVTSQRLVLFYAPSGAGKSSLINARLAPALREKGFDVLPIGRVGGAWPPDMGEVDNVFVASLILSLDQDQHQPTRLARLTLSAYLQQRQTARSDPAQPAGRVLVIDQFEELFTTHPEHWQQREDLIRQLNQALVEDSLLRVVLTLREDYVASLDPYAHLVVGSMQARFHMSLLEAGAALEAIQKPAQQAGRPFAPGVAEALVDNLRQIRVPAGGEVSLQLGQFIEPVQLQVVCYRLWEGLRDRPQAEITHADLAAFGSPDTALTQFYEQALADVTRETGVSEERLRDWFDHQLITEAGTRGLVHRGASTTAGLPNQVVDALLNRFLLRAETRAGATWYELADDRLLEPILAANRAWSARGPAPIQEEPAPAQAPAEGEIPAPVETIGPYGQADGPRQRFEEVMAGISFGGGPAPPRTITALVTERSSTRPLLLLAGGTLPAGTEVIQPAPAHGGARQDRIGVVEREVFSARCLAALARLEGERSFVSILPDAQPVAGIARPGLGLQVCKFGAGSGYTQGQVVQVAVNIQLTDDYQRTLTLQDGILIAGPDFSAPGDVGALVLAADTRQAVGVIVGHIQDQATVCLSIQAMLDQLGVDLVTRPVRYRSAQRPTEHIAATTDLIGGEDRLGFGYYVDAFVRLIEDTQPPLTIGIYGAWGSGKSFLMDKIAKRLKPEGDVRQVEKLTLWQKMFQLSRTQMPVIWFDAWDYNASDKLWAGLVERVFLGIENSGLGWYGQLRINLKRNLERRWRELHARLLPYTLTAIVIAALTVGFILNNQEAWARAIGGSTFLVVLIGLVRQLAGVLGTSASQRIVDLFATPDYTADIGFMGRIRQDLEDFANSLPSGMKVVVFIDDLDRCDPKKAVEVLEAIKLLLDFERFIVFLALDARIITQAVEEHYGKVLTEAEITGYEYLDKIVQIPFSIPEPPPHELRQYIGSLVGLSEADIPPLEAPAARQPPAQVSEPPSPPEFVPEPITPGLEAAQPVAGMPPPAEPAAIPSQGAAAPATLPQPAQPVTPPGPAEAGQALEDRVATSVVTFTRPEQQALLAFYAHLDPNPRRIKRIVNIYRLVRALIASQREAQPDSQAPATSDNPRHVLGWLILCEQWPYAAHVILEEFERNLKQTEPTLGPASVLMPLHQMAQERIAREGEEALKKLDLAYERLHSFIETHLHDFTLADLQRLRPYTVNFNPALSAEVRLTLARGGR